MSRKRQKTKKYKEKQRKKGIAKAQKVRTSFPKYLGRSTEVFKSTSKGIEKVELDPEVVKKFELDSEEVDEALRIELNTEVQDLQHKNLKKLTSSKIDKVHTEKVGLLQKVFNLFN